MKRAIALVLVMLFVVALMAGCGQKSDEELIKDRINEYVRCINNLDTNGAMECMDSKTRAGMESMLNMLGGALSGALGGFDLRDLMNVGAMFASNDVANMAVASIDNIRINGDKATVDVTFIATVNGQSQTATQNMPLTKEKDDWFLTLSLGGMF